jgi:hypothetical protein
MKAVITTGELRAFEAAKEREESEARIKAAREVLQAALTQQDVQATREGGLELARLRALHDIVYGVSE